MSNVFDGPIDRQASPSEAACIAAPDFRFAYFRTAAFAVRLLRLDGRHPKESPAHGERAQHQGRIARRILPSH
jgi:hypothetical protein